MRNLSRTEILSIASLIVSFVFFFISIGLLIGNGANIIVPYMALFTAIALSGLALVVGVINTRKPVLLSIESKPVVPFVQVAYLQVPVEKSVVARPIKNEPIVQTVESSFREQKIEPMDTLITVPVENQKMREEPLPQPIIETKTMGQKIIKPSEKTPTNRNVVKLAAVKKPKPKRRKSKGKKTKPKAL